ncbi:AAA family ATPase [Roseomonas sp. GCM10028921]
MGFIINPRGVGGSGKTELARRILAAYGWREGGQAELLRQEGREQPIGYRLHHPEGGRPLVVLGQYERTSGGCDTIPAAHGGPDEIFRLADRWAAAGHDVLLEGSAWSAEHRRSALLAKHHRLYVLHLSTPPERAARNLAARRRTRRSSWPLILRTVQAQHDTIEAACDKLRGVATVEQHDFEGALGRARELLGLKAGSEEKVANPSPHPIPIRRPLLARASIASFRPPTTSDSQLGQHCQESAA